jgi:hypothetical protein
MMNNLTFSKPTVEEALTRQPKTLGEAKEQICVLRELVGRKESSPRTAEIPGGSTLPEAEPGERIYISNGRNVVERNGRNLEVSALEQTAAYKRLFAAIEAAKDGRERFRIAAELGEVRRTYGTGRK